MPIWPIWPNFEVNGLDWQCCLAGSSKTAPRILIFSIAMGADHSFYVKTIETHARAFLPINISAIGTVNAVKPQLRESKVCTKVTLVDLGFNALYPS